MVLYEPIIIARKPFKGNLINNLDKWGVGGLNIDECRVGTETIPAQKRGNAVNTSFMSGGFTEEHTGRFPANTILTYNNETKEEVCSGFPYTKSQKGSISKPYKINNQVYGEYGYCNTWEAYNDSGSAARYFYNAKESEKDIENLIIDYEEFKDLGGLMNLYSENESYKLYQGNMLDMLDVIEPNSIDSIVTDPPYELNFMAKGWDNAGVSFQKETWEKCYEVLKPGGYLLAFGGSRTFHRIACAIEDAGFEIRDTIMWLYGSGFPKSMNIGLAIDKKNGVESKVVGLGKSGAEETHTNSLNPVKNPFGGEYEIKEAQNKWNGWGTCLKPSFEPVIVARKPFKGSCVDNVIEYGVGGINIDECRVEGEVRTMPVNAEEIEIKHNGTHMDTLHKNQQHERVETNLGRFPANTILTYDEEDKEEVCDGFPNTKSEGGSKFNKQVDDGSNSLFNLKQTKQDVNYHDSGSASRYFYCAKASKKDRDEGLENFEATTDNAKGNGLDRICEFCGVSQLTPELCHCETKSWITKPKKNTHPTVKPTDLMQYLVRLVTPNGGTILDPFSGSGSTGKAVMYENKERNKGYKYIGIELTEEYLPIAKARIEYVCNLEEKK